MLSRMMKCGFLFSLAAYGTALKDASDNSAYNIIEHAIDDEISTTRTYLVTTGNVFFNDITSHNSVAGLTISQFSQGMRGKLEYIENGIFSYTPDIAQNTRPDNSTYVVSDKLGQTSSAIVRVSKSPRLKINGTLVALPLPCISPYAICY